MKKYPDFYSVVVGHGPVGLFLGFVFVALICAAISVLIQASNRDIASNNTPVRFSWRFLFWNNIARIAANFLVLPVAIRLFYEYVPMPGMLVLACGLGFGVDRLAMLAQKFGLLTTNKLSDKMAEKINSSDLEVKPKQ